MKFRDLHLPLLTEAARDRYLTMFQEPVFKDENGKPLPEVLAMVNWAITNLKKEDWVVWYLRKFKIYYWWEKGDQAELLKSKWFANYKQKGGYDASYNPAGDVKNHSELNIPRLSREMKHYLDLMNHVPKMKDVVFGWREWGEIQQQWDELEQEFKGDLEDDDKVVDEYGEKIIEFADGYAWYDLKKGGCSIESKAMGHCGNGYDRGDDQETIFSLRRRINSQHPDFKDKMTPSLTFILRQKDKSLGEMKGRGNEKPAERYHPYILELLKSKYVEGIHGGGYMPQNNFSVADLTKDQQKELYAVKPQLFDLLSLYSIGGANTEFTERAKKVLSSHRTMKYERDAEGNYKKTYPQVSAIDEQGRVIIALGVGVSEMADELGLSELKNYAGYIEGGDYFDIDTSHSDTLEKLAEELISMLKNENVRIRESAQRVIEYMRQNYADEIDDNDYDLSSDSDLESLFKDVDDDAIETIARSAYASGEEVGASDELYDAFKSMMDRNNIIQTDGADGEWRIVLSMEDFGGRLQDAIADNEYNEYDETEYHKGVLERMKEEKEFDDLSVPYYGFSGFSDDAYLDRLVDEISEQDVFDIELPSAETA